MRETCLQINLSLPTTAITKRPAADAAQMVGRRDTMTWVKSEMGQCMVPAAVLTWVCVGGTSEKNEVSGYAIQEGCTNQVLDR